MFSAPIYILAGGRSRRFGSDKARAELEGTPLILHVKAALRAFDRVHVIADRPQKYDDLGVMTFVDHLPELGPIGGVATALVQARNEWMFVVACDQPDVEPAWLQMLWDQRAGALAIAFRTDRWQPLPSLWHREALSCVNEQIEAGRLALHDLLDHCEARPVPPPENWPAQPSINTPNDLSRWTRDGFDHTTP